MPVDGPSKGMLALTSGILAAYETLLPVFDGDEHRTILCLQHLVGTFARRPFEIAFEALGKRDNAPDAIDAACCKESPFYGSYFDLAFDRQDAGTFEMRAERCFFLDYSAATTTPGSPPCCAPGTPAGWGPWTPQSAGCGPNAPR